MTWPLPFQRQFVAPTLILRTANHCTKYEVLAVPEKKTGQKFKMGHVTITTPFSRLVCPGGRQWATSVTIWRTENQHHRSSHAGNLENQKVDAATWRNRVPTLMSWVPKKIYPYKLTIANWYSTVACTGHEWTTATSEFQVRFFRNKLIFH